MMIKGPHHASNPCTSVSVMRDEHLEIEGPVPAPSRQTTQRRPPLPPGPWYSVKFALQSCQGSNSGQHGVVHLTVHPPKGQPSSCTAHAHAPSRNVRIHKSGNDNDDVIATRRLQVHQSRQLCLHAHTVQSMSVAFCWNALRPEQMGRRAVARVVLQLRQKSCAVVHAQHYMCVMYTVHY